MINLLIAGGFLLFIALILVLITLGAEFLLKINSINPWKY